MKCTKHEQHDCVYCGRDKLESALAAASTRIFELERKLAKAEIERGWAIGEHKKALALIETLRGPVRTSEAIDWALTADEIGRQFRSMAIELEAVKKELEAMRAQKPCLFAYKISSSSSGFVYTTDESEAVMGGADSGGYKKLYTQPVPAPAQVPDEWRSVMQDLIAELEGTFCPADMCAKSGACCKEYAKQSVTEAKALLQSQPVETVIDKQEPNLYAQQQYSIIQKWSGQHNFVAGNDDFWRLAVMLADAAGIDRVYPKSTIPPGWQITRVPDVEFQPRYQIYISKIGEDGKAELGGTACRLDESSLFWHFFNDWLLMQESAG